MVALPPQHISPCATQLEDASALSMLSHTSPCATPMQTASARTPMPPPRQTKSKKIPKNMTGSGKQSNTKNGPKNMANSSVENALENVPTPGQNINKTSAVIKNIDKTFAPKGFNHLPQLKGEKVVGPVCYPSTPATTNFSYLS